ncbi:type II secretion system minor pseudopilin GspK [Bermanella marisrubri]|uniref:Type II secretion system protein K n=1 Tax=Bermanella marisrubri TaxID=207949 RepID=Q1N4H5_9GAMM|nr:type II secretion system minor pseudopilin GspK [Bermanella marisrubri]EAT13453.1 general secretion pathway protein K [Oceanobacter sp. RED65] [Bermanella marisrubri]QIZ84200.1 type II secretion system minor pseudopilin GspK [Bermanella marisrubri]
MHSPASKQQGLALITVLFIFALVSMLAISMQRQQARDIAMATASFEYQQAQVLALSAEDLAKAGLIYDGNRDIQNNQEWDGAVELWNQPLTTQLDPATVFVTVRDLQGLFNLNSLHPDAPDPNSALIRFQELLKELQIDTAIARSLKEWMTPDSSASYYYQTLEKPYAASGMALSHPSELMLIEGMKIEDFKKLEPYVTALPMKTQLNINTTPDVVLSSWDSRLSVSQAQSVLSKTRPGSCDPNNRANAIFQNIDDFWNAPEISSMINGDPNETNASTEDSTNSGSGWQKQDFTVKSQYFSVMIRVQYTSTNPDNPTDLVLESIMRRDLTPDTGFVGVIYRDFSRNLDDLARLKIVDC